MAGKYAPSPNRLAQPKLHDFVVRQTEVTIMARSVFHDLFSEEEAAELEMRAKLLSGINKWLNKAELTQTAAAKQLGVTQARISEIKNGKINRFSLSMLARLVQRAGLRPGIK